MFTKWCSKFLTLLIHHAVQINPSRKLEETIESVLKSFYMDDFLKLVPLGKQVKELCQEMIDVMAAGGFSLTKFKSTSQDVLDLLSADECEKSTKQMEIDKEQVKQTLGISWRINDDCIMFSKSIKQHTTMKWGIFSTISSFFDPQDFWQHLLWKPNSWVRQCGARN